jgi:hypothetical protein
MPVGKSSTCRKTKAPPAPANEQRASGADNSDDADEPRLLSSGSITDAQFRALLVTRHRHTRALKGAADALKNSLHELAMAEADLRDDIDTLLPRFPHYDDDARAAAPPSSSSVE